MREELVEGGSLVRLRSGSLAVEGVPAARRGLVVYSSLCSRDGSMWRRGTYRLTRRVIAGLDMWHVRRMPATKSSSPTHTPRCDESAELTSVADCAQYAQSVSELRAETTKGEKS